MDGGVISVCLLTCLCGWTMDIPVASEERAGNPPVTTVIHFGADTDSCAPVPPMNSPILHRLDLTTARARERLGALAWQAHEQFDRCMESDIAQSIIMTIGVAGYCLRGWNPH